MFVEGKSLTRGNPLETILLEGCHFVQRKYCEDNVYFSTIDNREQHQDDTEEHKYSEIFVPVTAHIEAEQKEY